MNNQSIIVNSNSITLENLSANQSKFCQVWPSAKEALTFLQNMVKNPIAKAAIGIVIAAGDAVSKQVCGATQ
jgi:hypothetical protein